MPDLRPIIEVIPETIRRAAGLFLSRLFPSSAILLVGIFFSRVISPEDYGIYTTLWVHLSVTAVLAAWGYPSLLLSHGSRLPFRQRRNFRKISHLLSFLLSFLAGVVFILFLGYSATVTSLSVLLLIIQTSFMMLESECVRRRKEWLLNLVNTVWAVGFVGIHGLTVWVGYDLDFLLSGWAVVSGLRLLALFVWAGREDEKENEKIPVAGIPTIWFGFGLNDAVQILSRWMDKIVAAAILIPAEFAIYFNGTFEIPVISMLMTSVGAIVTSRMSDNLRSASDDPFRVFRLTTRATSSIVFPVFFLSFWHRDWLITTLFSDAYLASATLFGIYIWVLPIRIGSFSSLMQVQGKSRQLVTGALLDLGLSLLLMILLYPLMGVSGLALALVAATWVQAGYYVVMAARSADIKVLKLIDGQSLLIRFLVTGLFTGLAALIPGILLSLILSFLTGTILSVFFLKNDLSAVRQKKI